MSSEDSLISVNNLGKWYQTRGDSLLSFFGEDEYLKAVDDVSFDIERNQIIGVAGQSGCGKSTLGELLVGLKEPTRGEILFEGEDISGYSKSEMQNFRKRAQVIFQNPYEALNPRIPIGRFVSEPLVIHGIGDSETRDELTLEALRDAGLRPPEKFLDKLPAELSGGERQRVCIARAIVLDPDFIVADEPVSMLDVSVRTGILHLFEKLREERDLTILYISHDLSTINYLADETMIMYLGDLVEKGPTEQVIHNPSHPYTEALLDAVPTPDPDESRAGSSLQGEVPDPVNLPKGCRFAPYCEYSTDKCRQEEPSLEPLDSIQSTARKVACYYPVDKDEEDDSPVET